MSISEALTRAKEKKVTCRCEKMTVRTAVPTCDHYTDADNREKAREKLTKQNKKKKRKETKFIAEEKNIKKFQAVIRK